MPRLPIGTLHPQAFEDTRVGAAAVELLGEATLPAPQPFRELGFGVEREQQDEGEQDC